MMHAAASTCCKPCGDCANENKKACGGVQALLGLGFWGGTGVCAKLFAASRECTKAAVDVVVNTTTAVVHSAQEKAGELVAGLLHSGSGTLPPGPTGFDTTTTSENLPSSSAAPSSSASPSTTPAAATGGAETCTKYNAWWLILAIACFIVGAYLLYKGVQAMRADKKPQDGEVNEGSDLMRHQHNGFAALDVTGAFNAGTRRASVREIADVDDDQRGSGGRRSGSGGVHHQAAVVDMQAETSGGSGELRRDDDRVIRRGGSAISDGNGVEHNQVAGSRRPPPPPPPAKSIPHASTLSPAARDDSGVGRGSGDAVDLHAAVTMVTAGVDEDEQAVF